MTSWLILDITMDFYDEPDFWLNPVTVTGPALLFLLQYFGTVPLVGKDTVSACLDFCPTSWLTVFVVQPILAAC